MTRLEDAEEAVRLGVDALGFVFFAASPRYIEPEVAAHIGRCLPPFVCKVGVFADADADTVRRVTRQTGVDVVQYHGAETPEQCIAGGTPFIKALRMSRDVDVRAACEHYAEARAILLDTHDREALGGTGQTFDWTRIPVGLPKPVILAGGLTPDNVAVAARRVSPYAVDVSSGIESSKGFKDVRKMRAFLVEVRGFESSG